MICGLRYIADLQNAHYPQIFYFVFYKTYTYAVC